jgi:hypothetical protein
MSVREPNEPQEHTVHLPAVHLGVAPEQVLESTHAPSEQVCVTLVVPDLQRSAPSVHTRHAPELHDPASAPTTHALPSARAAAPHTLPAQVAC